MADAQLIVCRDAPCGSRYGRRNGKGDIQEAYGFDLGLLAVRYEEFRAIIAEARAAREAKQQCRRQITIARKAIRQIALTGLDYPASGKDWEALLAETEGRRPGLIDDLDELEALANRLNTLWIKAKGELQNTVEISPSDEGDFIPKTNTTEKQLDLSTKGQTSQMPGGQDDATPPDHITIEQVVQAAPTFDTLIDRKRRRWPEVVKAAEHLRHHLGINKEAWDHACNVMHPHGAAVAMAIISAKWDLGEIESPGGYLRGITARAKIGEAHLGRSIWALLKR